MLEALATYRPFHLTKQIISKLPARTPSENCLHTAIRLAKIALLCILAVATFLLEAVVALPVLCLRLKPIRNSHEPAPQPIRDRAQESAVPDRYNLRVGTTRISLIKGDIAQQQVDCLVASVTTTLAPDGSEAIHQKAGPALAAECQAHPEIRPGVRCEVGDARITGAGNFSPPVRHIIHAVGPIYPDKADIRREAIRSLKNTYHKCLELAHQHNIRRVAFSALNAGKTWQQDYPAFAFFRAAEDYVQLHQERFDEIQMIYPEADYDSTYKGCRYNQQHPHAVEE